MKIEEMPVFERPYERLEKYGAESLTDAELLAIILKTGNNNESSVSLARRLLLENPYSEEGLRFLHTISIKELMKFKGIGKVKALNLKAVGEIVKRIEKPVSKNVKIESTSDAALIIMPKLRYEKNEKFCTMYLDSKNNLLKTRYYSNFKERSIDVPLKDVLKEAIKEESTRIIIAHNHPSGDVAPSRQDIRFTKELKEILGKLEIDLLDHIIIGDGNYISIMEYLK